LTYQLRSAYINKDVFRGLIVNKSSISIVVVTISQYELVPLWKVSLETGAVSIEYPRVTIPRRALIVIFPRILHQTFSLV